jgi:type VI protein secretion system component Hcp
MASDDTNELLMRILDSNGNFIGAECKTDVSGDTDDLASDFTNGSFFQVDDFSFGMNIDDKDPTADASNAGGSGGVGATAQNKQAGPEVKFGKWKSGSAADIKAMIPFPLRMDEFSLVRRFDRASPVFFEKCATSDSFQKATLLKRKVVGAGQLQSFLRIDFDDVLITHIDWDDDDVIKETIKFVFRKITVQYKTQAQSGRLNPAGSISWTYTADLRKPPGK